METFGCCSRYVECSDALKCLHADEPEYAGCGYRKNLEKGRVFYGINAGKVINLADPEQKVDKHVPAKVYLACFRELFAVYARHKNTFSYSLSKEQASSIAELFDSLSIPYRTEINHFDEIEGTMVEDDSPANSRTVFIMDGQEFNVLNFNGYLIKNYYADRICKAFKSKGVEGRIELIGSSAGASFRTYSSKKPKQQAQREEVKPPDMPSAKKPVSYVQVSLFDMMKPAAV